jgi:ATP-dependent RNA helicase RhlE
MSFSSFGLSQRLLDGIRDAGYTTPTPIQSQAIPIAVSGDDLIGCAQTGTGKTAAFVLPMLNRLMAGQIQSRDQRRRVRALVITPTRELAAQIEGSIKTCGRYTKLRALSVYGGVGIEPQIRMLRSGVDIVIATPGRLLDHINRRSINLADIELLVLDEADRMFDMGFINDIRKIVSLLPADRQTLLFSATMPPAIRALAQGIQREPKLVEVGERRNPAESVTQHIYPVSQEQKMELLLHIFESEDMDSVIVFSRTKHGADRIAARLERHGIDAVALHSDRTQSQRMRALEGFKQGRFRVMVATDIAARGIDVDGISHVINYDTPTSPEDYIHRIGRTGRAETTGDALTFVARNEEQHLRRMEQHIGRRFQRKHYPDFEYRESAPAEGSRNGDRRPGYAGRPISNQGRDPRFDNNRGGRSNAQRRKRAW